MNQNLSLKAKQSGCFSRWMCIWGKLETLWQTMVKNVKTVQEKVGGREWIFWILLQVSAYILYHPLSNTFWELFEWCSPFFSICLVRRSHLKDDSLLQKGYLHTYRIAIRCTMLDKALFLLHLWDLSPTVCVLSVHSLPNFEWVMVKQNTILFIITIRYQRWWFQGLT